MARLRHLALLLVAIGLLATACGRSSPNGNGEPADTTDPIGAPTEEAAAEPPATEPPPLPVETPGSRTGLSLDLGDGRTLEFTIVLPNDFEAGLAFPVLLALPPGRQRPAEVDAGLDLYWDAEARKRGWIVVSPVAPNGLPFFQGPEELIPPFLAQLASLYPPEGGKFHVAGVSNGGLSAFRIALNNPELFHSLMTLPGFPPGDPDFDRLDRLAGTMPVTMFVGENDRRWRELAEKAEAELRALGADVSLTVSGGEGHILQAFSGSDYFDVLEAAC